MKSLQTISTFFFLLLTIPLLIFLSARQPEVQVYEKQLKDSLESPVKENEDAMNEKRAVPIQASLLDFSAIKEKLDNP